MSPGEGMDSISWIKLLPIVLTCAVWGRSRQGQRVMVYCNNTGALAIDNSGYSKLPQIMHLLQCFFFIRALYQLSVHMVCIEGNANTWADAISCNYSVLIDSQVFKSTYHCTPLLEDLISLFIMEQPDWTSTHLF